jgi:sugar (pentulose or hexulose) kinase
MTHDTEVVVGLDMGTGGARAIAMNLSGDIRAEGSARLPANATTVAGPCVEQNPLAWSSVAQQALRAMTSQLPAGTQILGLAVDATSGTFVFMDRHGQPASPGYMYNDQRATDVAAEVAAALDHTLSAYGIQIAVSFALPKIVHLLRQKPAWASAGHRIVHQTDWLVGMLCGDYETTDISTALKTGADPGTLSWPAAIEQLGIPHSMLPRLVLPGTELGKVTATAEAQTGIPRGTPIVAGCTDGTAGLLASGAKEVGDLNVTLGTTLVFKAIAPQPLLDPAGAIYNHRHPAGGYLPGAASSTGAEWIEAWLPGADLNELGQQVLARLPSDAIAYPLVKVGERFPISWPTARGFGLDTLADPVLRFAAGMEGVAYLERMGIERFEQLGLPIGATIYSTGGGVASEAWLRIRASVSRRALAVPTHAGCCVGAAVLAAMPTLGSCAAATTQLVRLGRTVEPVPEWSDRYERQYQRFREMLVTHSTGRSDG